MQGWRIAQSRRVSHLSLWTVVAAPLTLTALFAYVNHRLLRLPPSIGVMSVALAFSLGLLALDALGVPVDGPLRALVRQVHFDSTLLHGLLGFLLFAGALSVDLPGLRRNGVVVAVLATVGVGLSALAVGGGTWWVLRLLGEFLPLGYCLPAVRRPDLAHRSHCRARAVQAAGGA